MNPSNRRFPMLTVALSAGLVVALCVSVWALFLRDEPQPLTPDYVPQGMETHQKPLETEPSDPAVTPSKPTGGAIQITYRTRVTVDLSEQSVDLLYANPQISNRNVSILLMVGDLVIATSDLIAPGYGVTTLPLDDYARERLSVGGYDGELVVRAYHPETGEKASVDATGHITVTVTE